MIDYIINGKSFGNCVDYVTRRAIEERLYNEQSHQQKTAERKYEANNGEDIIEHLSKGWHLLCATSDIRIDEGRKAMAEDIARTTKTRKHIKDPVGHISLDFHPKDKPKMTDELMAEIAQDYMRQMGLTNTPFIVVRHYDKEHPHCHIVFSRVDYDGKILTQTTNFKKNERVCKALNRKYQLMQGKSKLNTDVSKLRGKEKVRYQLVQDIAKLFIHPSVKDWDSYLDILRQHGMPIMSTPSATPKPKLQSKSVVIPPLPDGFMGARIAPHDLDRYQRGEAICAYICNSDDIVGKHHWIWYDFKTCQPRCELTPLPADRYIPEAFKQPSASSKATSTSQSQVAGITLSSPSFSGGAQDNQGFASGDGMSDDFKLWLSRHPGLSIDEALHRYRDEQKAKQRRRGPKL